MKKPREAKCFARKYITGSSYTLHREKRRIARYEQTPLSFHIHGHHIFPGLMQNYLIRAVFDVTLGVIRWITIVMQGRTGQRNMHICIDGNIDFCKIIGRSIQFASATGKIIISPEFLPARVGPAYRKLITQSVFLPLFLCIPGRNTKEKRMSSFFHGIDGPSWLQ